ncbi:MAG TPA: hypothetical protein VF251_02410 [Pyrinomonadaceae bacterium]
MTESEVFEAVTNGGSSDFAILIDILNRHGSWCLIGGLAVNCYVEPVYTLDADIVVVASKLSMIKRDLVEAKFFVEEFEHSVNARMAGSDLRIQFSLDPRYQSFLDHAKPMKVLGQDVPVASLSDIVRRKVWAWSDVRRRNTKRKKDELDLMRILEAYPETRALMPEQIKAQVPE